MAGGWVPLSWRLHCWSSLLPWSHTMLLLTGMFLLELTLLALNALLLLQLLFFLSSLLLLLPKPLFFNLLSQQLCLQASSLPLSIELISVIAKQITTTKAMGRLMGWWQMGRRHWRADPAPGRVWRLATALPAARKGNRRRLHMLLRPMYDLIWWRLHL